MVTGGRQQWCTRHHGSADRLKNLPGTRHCERETRVQRQWGRSQKYHNALVKVL